MTKHLVIGGSGFLGSHVVRRLAATGEDVRAFVRPGSSTLGIEGLAVERAYGDIFDRDTVRAAMTGCSKVYYCVVDARVWLKDPAPLWRTNVEGLRGVLDVATAMNLERFVFTSSIITIGIPTSGLATEADMANWQGRGGVYADTRVRAEDMVLDYARTRGLPAMAMCVSTTYGAGDWLPTPQGNMLAAAIRGKLPFYVSDSANEVVGIDDAARALVLAGEHGHTGERYIISDRSMGMGEIFKTACAAVGATPPSLGIPVNGLVVAAAASSAISKLTGKESRLTPLGVRMMKLMPHADHSKATRELGWVPRPVTEEIVEAAEFFKSRHR